MQQTLKDLGSFEPAVRMTALKLCIQWVMVQHKIKDSEGFGTEFLNAGEEKDE